MTHPNNLMPALHQHSEVRQEQSVIQQLSKAEIAHRLHFRTSNKLQKDGRINAGVDAQGNLLAISVSPFARSFRKNIEPGIWPVVSILRAKGYLTYSSCEGHSLRSRRFVGVAFGDQASRDDFIERVRAWGEWGVFARPKDTIANLQSWSEGGSVKTRNAKNENVGLSPEEEAYGFNVMFKTDYPRFYFAELIIYDEWPVGYWLYHPIKAIQAGMAKKWHWDRTTAKVAGGIRDDAFPLFKKRRTG